MSNCNLVDMKKEYKATSPVSTITRIKAILGKLGLLTSETYVESSGFYSCRITIGNDKIRDLNIGTNGKGPSFEYSLASGYAEFMERLQNNMLLFARRFATDRFLKSGKADQSYRRYLQQQDLIFDFYYDPNEKYCSKEEVLSSFGKEMCALFNYDDIGEFAHDLAEMYGDKSYLCVPIYDCQNQKELLVPIELCLSATGSNGMASGNIPSEALLQGMCEIFERYAVSQIYTYGIVPPTIPHSYFKNPTVKNKLEYLISIKGYELIIKDCSLGKGLPVIGLIIIDKKNKRYNFKLASDFVEDIALDRCLNELYQGLKSFKSIPFDFYDEDDLNCLRGIHSSHVNLERIFVNGSGHWPLTIFSNASSYDHTPFPSTYGLSNDSDLRIAFDIVYGMGFNVFVRNNSYLGFPAFYILIPGMSQIISDRRSLIPTYANPDLSEIVNLGTHNTEVIKNIIDQLEKGEELIDLREKSYAKNYPYWIDSDITDIEIRHLLAMLYYYVGCYEKAYDSMCRFLENKNTMVYEYFFAVKDFIYLYRIKSLQSDDVINLLGIKYTPEIACEIHQDMSDNLKVLDCHNFPAGFNILKSDFQKNSALFEILSLEKRMHDEYLQHPVCQSDLKDLFA